MDSWCFTHQFRWGQRTACSRLRQSCRASHGKTWRQLGSSTYPEDVAALGCPWCQMVSILLHAISRLFNLSLRLRSVTAHSVRTECTPGAPGARGAPSAPDATTTWSHGFPLHCNLLYHIYHIYVHVCHLHYFRFLVSWRPQWSIIMLILHHCTAS